MATSVQEPVKSVPTEHVENNSSGKHEEVIASAGARNAAFAEALALENPRPFRKSFIKLYLCLFVAYMCSSTNGFDANTFGRLLDRPRPVYAHKNRWSLGGA
jgi:hypothetical protein